MMANEEIKPLKVVDYIDRFEVLELLGNKIDLFSESPMDNDDFTKMKLAIEIELEVRRLPILDVVEVKHGEWIDTGDEILDTTYSGWKCSECGYVFCGDKFKFCPECGAKMDGGKEDGKEES